MAAAQVADGNEVAKKAEQYVGYRYVYGAAGPDSFDCSGLVIWCYKDTGVKLPRSANDQSKVGEKIGDDWNMLVPGDLLFFYNPIKHVGIYIGLNSKGQHEFVHAANSKKGVIRSTLEDPFWTKTYQFGRRVADGNSTQNVSSEVAKTKIDTAPEEAPKTWKRTARNGARKKVVWVKH